MNTGSVQSPTPTLPEVTISLTTEALCTLNFMATVDLSVLQVSGTQTRTPKYRWGVKLALHPFLISFHFFQFLGIFRSGRRFS